MGSDGLIDTHDSTVERWRTNLVQTLIEQVPPDNVQGQPGRLLITTTVAVYPTSAGVFYGVRTALPGGSETEGGAVSTSATGGTYFAANTGSAIPPVGTPVLGRLIGRFWTFKYDG